MSRDSLNDILNSVNIRRGAIQSNYKLKQAAIDDALELGVSTLASLDMLNENRIERKELNQYADEFDLTWNKKSKKYEGIVGINNKEERFGITRVQLEALKTYDDGSGIMSKVIDGANINPRYHLQPSEPDDPSWISKLASNLFSKDEETEEPKTNQLSSPNKLMSQPTTLAPITSGDPQPPVRPTVPVETEEEFFNKDVIIEETDFDVFDEWDKPDPVVEKISKEKVSSVVTTEYSSSKEELARARKAVRNIISSGTTKEIGENLAKFRNASRLTDKEMKQVIDSAFKQDWKKGG
jgi:hypothetical protein